MDNCPACSPNTSTGYRIEFPDSNICDRIVSSLQWTGDARPVRVQERSLWMTQRLFYDSTDYFTAHCEPTDWLVYREELGEASASVHALSWNEAVAARPETWIYELISTKRIRMMYQPIIDCRQPHVPIGYEMLARGYGEDGVMIPPVRLFSAARDQNQLFGLDRACRLEAIEAASRLPATCSVFVNFIPTSIYVPEHCLATTMAAVTRVGIRPEQVVFEVVETERVDDLEHLRHILRFYRDQGFRYALDDVGQGFNNLQTLQALEPDVVKLDREWVSAIHLDREKRAVAQKVLDICWRIGATPLAEGIEYKEEAHVLCELGYTWQQGYYYGRPAYEPAVHSPADAD